LGDIQMTPEEFIDSYFRERRERERTWRRYWRLFYKKFFKDPPRQNPAGCEHILLIESAAETSTIMVEETAFEGATSRTFRYHLGRNGESWLIEKVECQCFLCNGTGKTSQDSCEVCRGNGWAIWS
jgi:hypothetical protein